MENTQVNETWFVVPTFPVYEVSSTGVVRRIASRKVIKARNNMCGYPLVSLCMNGIERTVAVHRIVALSAIDNPENKRCVNHINGIKHDNRVANLEWCTHSENMKHSYSVLGRKGSQSGRFGSESTSAQPVEQFCLVTGIVLNRFECSEDAERKFGFIAAAIRRVCRGVKNKHRGFGWRNAQ